MDCVKRNNVKGKLFKAFHSMYSQVKACVRLNGDVSNYIHCPFGLKQGCMASPLLFSLFINALADIINSSGLRGIQLFPDAVEILILLFADDVTLCSDTVIGLQRQINLLYNYCQDSGLSVNTNKTKIMVFKRGGQLWNHEHWTYNGNEISIVSNLTYVGVLLHHSYYNYNIMVSQQAVKAKRAFISLNSSLYKFGQLPKSIYFK